MLINRGKHFKTPISINDKNSQKKELKRKRPKNEKEYLQKAYNCMLIRNM